MSDATDTRANALAQWLSSPLDGAIPDSVDPEVVEAIIILRPERAPPHTIAVEDVLSAITAGPLMDPTVAAALQRWLDAGPGTAPPPELPVGVVETTYALRPGMAPSLGVSIEDVLAGVEQGPLAKTTLQDAPAGPRNAPAGPQRDSIAQQALMSERRKWWTGTAVGVTAVAAAAVLFVAPVADEAIQGPEYFADDAVAQANRPPTTEQTVTLLESAREPVGTADAALRGADADPGAADVKPTAAPSNQEPNPRKLRSPPAARAQRPDRSGVDAGNSSPTASASAASPTRPTSAVPANARTGDGADAPKVERPAPVEAEAEQAVHAHPIARGVRGVSRSEHRIDGEAPDVDSSAKAPRSQATESSAEHPSSAASNSGNDSSVSRRGTAGIQTIQRARTLLESGQTNRALRAVESGLKQSGIDPITAARLWRLKAEILTAMGRSTDAQQARETAAKLDPLR